MVEHSNFVVRAVISDPTIAYPQFNKFLTAFTDDKYHYIGGNLTAWYEVSKKYIAARGVLCFIQIYGDLFGIKQRLGVSNWQVCPHDEIPKELHRYSAKFICDRGVSHELVRHRPCSFAQESTRYVNYGGKDMEFIEPDGFEDWTFKAKDLFKESCIDVGYYYNSLLSNGLKPQQARVSLSNALKTEIVVTADAAEWAHIRKLRTAKSSHPDMQRVMSMVPWEEFL